MCVPCAAAVPEIWPLLLLLIGLPVLVVASAVMAVSRGLWAVRVVPVMLAEFVFRFVSGALLSKPSGMSDDEAWRLLSPRTPRVTRPVRATLRLVPTAAIVGLFVSPLVVAITTGTLVVAAAGTAIYTRRYEIQRAIGKPIRATIDREAITR